MELRYESESPEQTYAYGKELGEILQDGDIVALYGELGAGKTVFAKGIAAGLLVADEITSPTFTLQKDYCGRLNLHHFDLYRIEDLEELEHMGFYDNLGDGVCVIEWSERAGLPQCIKVYIETAGPNDPDKRIIIIDRFEESYENTGR